MSSANILFGGGGGGGGGFLTPFGGLGLGCFLDMVLSFY